MNDECITEDVLLQDNGIVRNSEGVILGRLGRSIQKVYDI